MEDLGLREAIAAWLKKMDWGYIATFTFKPSQNPNKYVGANEGFRLQESFIEELGIAYYFSVAEFHSCRKDIHLHTLLKTSVPKEEVAAGWSNRFGRATVNIAGERAVEYVVKSIRKSLDNVDFYVPRSKTKIL